MSSAKAAKKVKHKGKPDTEAVFVGRQPIYDAKLKVFGYELLFRDSDTGGANITDGHVATSQVIVNTFLEIGLDQIIGPRDKAFINMPRSFFLDETLQVLPADRVVLEVLEDVKPDAEVNAGIKALSDQGYTIALDDFLFHDSLKPLVELSDLIKIDIMGMKPDQIREHVELLKPYGRPLLAEKVETQEEFQYCKALGFTLFQGYFFAKPKVIRGQKTPSNRLAIMRLLGRLQDPAITADELEGLIVQDVALSYKILRYINSAALALPRKVESIQQAVVYLGLQTIKTWVTLLSLSGLDDKPAELLVTALIRGRMCEELGKANGERKADSYFTVGLFSALDALMDSPLEGLLEELPLSEAVKAALLKREGILGEALNCVLKYERGDWFDLRCGRATANDIGDAYLSAVAWSRQTSEGIAAST